jgi:hypothetical protein
MFTFTYTNKDDGITVTVTTEELTWRQLLRTFYNFLQGCSFIIDPSEFALDEVFSEDEETGLPES